MFKGTKVIDVHGHMSTPPDFRAHIAGNVNLNTPSKLKISDERLEPALQGHLKVMDERSIDLQLVGPRPVAMWHWMRPFLQENWTQTTNDVIAQSVKLHPDRFVGMAQLPQSPYLKGTKNCAEELERCVKELGFVGGYLNPDPGGKKQVPGVNDEFWYPLYEKAQALDAVLMVHPSASYDPRLEAIPHNYQINNVTEEYIAMMLYQHTSVFQDFPRLKIIICHCGGALQRFIPTDHHLGHHDLSNNLFFDTCAYDDDFLTAAIRQKGVDRMLFGTEAPGSGNAPRPDTGRPGDDLVPVIDSLPILSEEDKVKIFNTNPKKVFKLLKA
jgi:predicted TIM-barrel fold metal-dependent hydrolase